MNVFSYDGDSLTHERLLPGNTATGISAGIRVIPRKHYLVKGQNLVTYGNMEAGNPVTGWTDTAKAVNASNTSNRTGSAGTKAIAITLAADGAGHGSYHDITTVAGKYYRLRFYYKNGTGDFCQIQVVNDRAGTPADIIADTDLADSTSYSTAQDYFFTALGTSTTIYLNGKNHSDVVYFDDVSIMEVDVTAATAAGEATAWDKIHDGREGAHAIAALVSVESNSMRFLTNGEVPTGSAEPEPNHGHEVDSGQSYVVLGVNAVRNFKCIDSTSGSASEVNITCFFR